MVKSISLLPDGRMTAKAAAAYLGLSSKTLANMRCKGTGPAFIKIGKVFYFKTELDNWILRKVANTTAQARNL